MSHLPTSERTGIGHLVGRSAEMATVTAFLDRTSNSGAALLVTGEPGVGKTAVLEAAAEAAAASGTTVLRASGVDFEAGIDFAGLHLLLLPLLGELAALPVPQADALTAALGLSGGPAAPPLLVSAASLSLLRHVAARRPVLLQVDDLPQLDGASASVLGFVARRLDGSPIGLLGSAVTGSPCVLLSAGLPQLELPPLDPASASALLADRFPTLTAATASGSWPRPRAIPAR